MGIPTARPMMSPILLLLLSVLYELTPLVTTLEEVTLKEPTLVAPLERAEESEEEATVAADAAEPEGEDESAFPVRVTEPNLIEVKVIASTFEVPRFIAWRSH